MEEQKRENKEELQQETCFDASAEKTQFIMPNTGVTIRAMYRMADVEEPDVLGTVAVVATGMNEHCLK